LTEVWRATFKLTSLREARVLSTFLKKKLLKPNKFKTVKKPYPAVVIESPSEDTCFRTGVWVKNRNPLGKRDYSVEGVDEQGRTLFQSGCPICRREKQEGVERTPHYSHENRRQPATPAKTSRIIDVAPVYGGGQITIPKQARDMLKLSNGDKVVFSRTPNGKILLYKA